MWFITGALLVGAFFATLFSKPRKRLSVGEEQDYLDLVSTNRSGWVELLIVFVVMVCFFVALVKHMPHDNSSSILDQCAGRSPCYLYAGNSTYNIWVQNPDLATYHYGGKAVVQDDEHGNGR